MRSLLFRLLLCITLLLNGIGSVMASVHVQLEMLTGDTVAASVEATPEGHDCGQSALPEATAQTAPEREPQPGVTDCMKLCMELSLQPVQALAALPALAPITPAVDAPARRVAPGLASTPRLPPLRPPIGA